MLNDSSDVALVFNGEIYNAVEFRDELLQKGYVFKGHSDTEVVLDLYLEYGIEMLGRLNGMFAIAIYDKRTDRLYLARDRVGIKPLYYYKDNRVFLFSSEIKSIVKSGKADIEIDETAYNEIFTFGFSIKRTLVKNIVPLQPGTYLEYYRGTIKKHRWFNLNDYKRPESNQRMGDICQSVKRVMRNCVKRQMVSDVKVGLQLSGGIDSSLVSYYASHSDEGFLRDSIAIVFDRKYGELNEEKYIDFVSKKCNLKAHKEILTPEFYISNLEFINWYLDTIPAYYNEPGIYLLSGGARKHVTVLLSGEGADELFAGYSRIAFASLFGMVCRITKLIPALKNRKIWKGRQGYSFNDLVVFNDAVPLSICNRVLKNYDDNAVSADRKAWMKKLTGGYIDRHIKYELMTRLQGLLNRQDKCTMANSIENRVPLLDNEMLDFAFSIPARSLVRYRVKDIIRNRSLSVQGKYPLKLMCRNIFGENFAFRKKGGFDIPCRDFLSDSLFGDYFYSRILPGMKGRGLLNDNLIKEWYQNLATISPDELNALWRCINLEIISQLIFDGKEPEMITK